MKILKARTFEPSYQAKQAVSASTDSDGKGRSPVKLLKSVLRGIANFVLQPDPQVLWLPAAWRRAGKILKEHEVDVILATAPPFSSLVLGAYLSRRNSIPLVLDYRDEWDISNQMWENKSLGGIQSVVQRALQNYALKRAHAVVATSSLSAGALEEKVTGLGKDAKVWCIYNGFDASDFKALPVQSEKPARTRYRISYVGTLWNLTSIAPMVQALTELARSDPKLAAGIELVVAGRRTAEQEALIDQLQGNPVTVTRLGYLDHGEALQLMNDSDGLCLLLSNLNEARRVVPAKVFEYLATRNTIFALAPEGEIWKLLADFPRAYCIEPADTESLVRCLKQELERFNQAGSIKDSTSAIEKFERRRLTAELIQIFDLIKK